MTENRSFQGKYAIITGSTQGLGEATARLFAERGAAGIIICGRNQENGQAVARDIQSMGCDAHYVRADLAEIDDCRHIMRTALQHFPTIHTLVNAAALTQRGSIWNTTPEFWDRMMAINVRAPFLLVQDAVKVMFRDKVAGTIINIGSTSGFTGQPFLTPYATSKGALVTLTRNVAYAVMHHKIRVNALNLGWMDTPGEHTIQKEVHNSDDNWLEVAEAQQPFGRLIKTEEAARAIAFLASDESGMLTGSVINYDQSVLGGGDAAKPSPDEWGVAGIPYE